MNSQTLRLRWGCGRQSQVKLSTATTHKVLIHPQDPPLPDKDLKADWAFEMCCTRKEEALRNGNTVDHSCLLCLEIGGCAAVPSVQFRWVAAKEMFKIATDRSKCSVSKRWRGWGGPRWSGWLSSSGRARTGQAERWGLGWCNIFSGLVSNANKSISPTDKDQELCVCIFIFHIHLSILSWLHTQICTLNQILLPWDSRVVNAGIATQVDHLLQHVALNGEFLSENVYTCLVQYILFKIWVATTKLSPFLLNYSKIAGDYCLIFHVQEILH